MNKTIASLLMFLTLAVWLTACSSGPVCDSGTEKKPGNIDTGGIEKDATIGTLCVDKAEYKTGDTVHMTFTVKNALDEQIVLDGGQPPVMDICPAQHQCLSQYQTDVAQLTRLVLEPGQSHTIQWDWPTPEVDLHKAVNPASNQVYVHGYWGRLDKGPGQVMVQLLYGPRMLGP